MKEKIRSNALLIIDIVILNVSFISAYFIRFILDQGEIYSPWKERMFQAAVFYTILKIVCFLSFRLYQSLWRHAGLYELTLIVRAVIVANAIIIMFSVINPYRLTPLSVPFITIMTDTFLLGGSRVVYRYYRRWINGEPLKLKDRKNVLIIGTEQASANIIREVKANTALKSRVIGLIDNNNYMQGKKLSGIPVLGKIDDIERVVISKKIDEIIIALPYEQRRQTQAIYNQAIRTECNVKILPSVSELIDEKVTVQSIRDVDVVDLLGREPVMLDTEEISENLNNKVVMITGAGGSIGSEICRQISMFYPQRLILLDNYENGLYEIQNELRIKYPNLKTITIVANVRERNRISRIFREYNPQIVYHAAAHKHVPLMEENPEEAVKNNVYGTMNVAEAALEYGSEKFVLISTDKAVNSTNVMGATKRIAEKIIRGLNNQGVTEYVAVRFGNVLGSNGSVVPLFKKQIEEGGPVTVTHKEVIRYFMTIPEAVQLVIQAGAMAKGGEIFVLDMGEPVKIYDLACNLIRLSGFEPEDDIAIEITGLRPGEKLYEELLTGEEGLSATKNDKIFVSKQNSIDYEKLKIDINKFNNIEEGDYDLVTSYLQSLVHSYTPTPNK